ncbi:cell division protein FtsL [Neisseria sp. Ec49-e6-T10]|uniref:cell division protein FtsL n=1 Tax=Neisseria sp. Ec49-e6-T10 TaxID=3140744 RepID=UPI003EB6AFE2
MNKLNVFLLVLVIISAFGVVVLQDEAKKNFIALEQAQKEAKRLDEEYAQLVLVQTSLAKHAVVEELAKKQGLYAPSIDQISVIEP